MKSNALGFIPSTDKVKILMSTDHIFTSIFNIQNFEYKKSFAFLLCLFLLQNSPGTQC